MSETNIQNNSALISLSRAAQLTGYHQDYLGQLCRLGKLSAIKVGRNWFTYPDALNKLNATEALATEPDTSEQVEMLQQAHQEAEAQSETGFDFSAPEVVQNVTVSQVDGLPISIRTIAMPARNINTVQNILTTLRIDSLQREVLELRQLLTRLMVEVAGHTTILQNRQSLSNADSLKHSYVSSFDFNAPYSRRNIMLVSEEDSDQVMDQVGDQFKINFQPASQQASAPRYSLVAFLSAVAVMAAFAVMTYGVVSGQFFGSTNSEVSTIYYQAPIIASEPQPTVAGDIVAPESVDIPQ